VTSSDTQSHELQQALDKANEDLKVLQAQADAATTKISDLTTDVKDRDEEIKNLKIQLAKAQQADASKQAIHLQRLKPKLKGNNHADESSFRESMPMFADELSYPSFQFNFILTLERNCCLNLAGVILMILKAFWIMV
jgi:chromosome segregation ATPase